MATTTDTLNTPNPQHETASPGTLLGLTDEMIDRLAASLIAHGVTVAPKKASEDPHVVWERRAAVLHAEHELAVATGQRFADDDPADPIEQCWAIEDRMAETPALTVAGILTQLRLVQREANEHGCFSTSADAALRNMAASLEALASGSTASTMKHAQTKPRGVTASLLATAEPRQMDANLLQAWTDWLAAEREYDAAPPEEADDRTSSYNIRSDSARELIELTPALTPAGAAARVRLALAYIDENGTSRDAMLAGQSIDDLPEPLGDFREVLLWRAIGDLERMAAA